MEGKLEIEVGRVRKERKREEKQEGSDVDGPQLKIQDPPIDHQHFCLKVAKKLALVL